MGMAPCRLGKALATLTAAVVQRRFAFPSKPCSLPKNKKLPSGFPIGFGCFATGGVKERAFPSKIRLTKNFAKYCT
jgi:hypothetical protein